MNQENESKRNRAVKRTGDERKQREQKEQEIIKLKKQCKERQDEETRLRRDLEEHRRYHDFLAQVGGRGVALGDALMIGTRCYRWDPWELLFGRFGEGNMCAGLACLHADPPRLGRY